ncbi:MAG: hypothetical protein M3530_06535 [Thermoproteota archaeon]|nr:hypothetical protein [Thermoproteota archaeon]
MSTISIPHIGTLKGITSAKTKVKEKTSSNRDYYIIMGLSCILFGIVLVTMMLGPIAMSYYAVTTGPSIDQISECRQTILGFEQRGFYASQEQFKIALSYCYHN